MTNAKPELVEALLNQGDHPLNVAITNLQESLKRQGDIAEFCRDRAEAAEKRAKELEESRDLDKVVLDEGIEIINELETSNKLLSERVAVLEGALEPFVAFVNALSVMRPGWDHDDFIVFIGENNLTLAPFRRARTALEGK